MEGSEARIGAPREERLSPSFAASTLATSTQTKPFFEAANNLPEDSATARSWRGLTSSSTPSILIFVAAWNLSRAFSTGSGAILTAGGDDMVGTGEIWQRSQ